MGNGLPLWVWFCIICTQKALTDWEEGREETLDRGSCRRRDRRGFIAQGSPGKGMCICHRFVVGGMYSEERTTHQTAWSGEKQTEQQIEPHQHYLVCQAAAVCLEAHTERILWRAARVRASGAAQLLCFLGPGEA